MCKGLCGIAALTGLFVSVFVGALAYRLIKKTGIDEVTESEGYQSEPQSLVEGRPLRISKHETRNKLE